MNYEYPTTQSARKLPTMPDCDFVEWGIGQWVYIKPIQEDSQRIFAIFAANGQRIGIAGNCITAMASAIQEGFTPLNLH